VTLGWRCAREEYRRSSCILRRLVLEPQIFEAELTVIGKRAVTVTTNSKVTVVDAYEHVQQLQAGRGIIDLVAHVRHKASRDS